MENASSEMLLHRLLEKQVWQDFLETNRENGHLSPHEEMELRQFIDSGNYKVQAEKLISSLNVDFPKKLFINKMASDKKRIVYSFNKEDKMLLKLLNHLMQKYDKVLSDNVYSFREGRSLKDVCFRLKAIPSLSEKYACKTDLHDYFNSIPVERLVEKVKAAISDDLPLQTFLVNLLTQNKAFQNGKLIEENRGAMAGCPLGGFFANLYLKEVDDFFEAKGIPYFRYSDDMIFFTDTKEEQEKYSRTLNDLIEKEGLEVNRKKCIFTKPEEEWEFLGISYGDGIFDLSSSKIKKTKKKISKRAKGLLVWKNRKGESFEKVAGILIRTFNLLFFGEGKTGSEEENLFCWKRWYFPVINTDRSLKIIDAYLQEEIRYLSSGRHYKGNYKVTYDDLKKLGYRSLVNEYYRNVSGCGIKQTQPDFPIHSV